MLENICVDLCWPKLLYPQKGYYVFDGVAASAAAASAASAAAVLVVYALTGANINGSFSNLVEWKISPQRRTLLSLVKIRFPKWPPGGVLRHKFHVFAHNF